MENQERKKKDKWSILIGFAVIVSSQHRVRRNFAKKKQAFSSAILVFPYKRSRVKCPMWGEDHPAVCSKTEDVERRRGVMVANEGFFR